MHTTALIREGLAGLCALVVAYRWLNPTWFVPGFFEFYRSEPAAFLKGHLFFTYPLRALSPQKNHQKPLETSYDVPGMTYSLLSPSQVSGISHIPIT
jgi:hypothetical protein